MVFLSHPTGNEFSRALLRALRSRDLLARFQTTLAFDPVNPVWKWMPSSLRNECLRRGFDLPAVLLETHRWIASLPHRGVLAEMRRHDVLAFPSLFEGFGLVILEAMSQGLPVITTPHTAGPDVIEDGRDGFLVPIRAPTAIAEKLELLHHDREKLAEMSRAAMKKAAQFTWDNYGQSILETIQLMPPAGRKGEFV
mgnify:CR=1 FL=1